MRRAVVITITLGLMVQVLAPALLASTATTTMAADVSILSMETIISDSGAKRFLSINEHAVTWTYFDSSPPIHPKDGKVWDRDSRTVLNITLPGESLLRHIVCGRSILWSNGIEGELRHLYGFSLSNASRFSVPLPVSGWAYPVACDGSEGVGLRRNHLLQEQLFVFDSSTWEFQFLDLPGNQSHPDIWGDTIVWLDDRLERSTAPLGAKGSLDVYSLNLTTGVEQRLTNDTSQPGPPQVWNGFVVWADLRGKDPEYSRTGKQTTSVDPSFDPDLMAHDLSTGRTWIAAPEVEVAFYPGSFAFDRGVLIWHLFDSHVDPLMVLDLPTARRWTLDTGVDPLGGETALWDNTLALVSNDTQIVLLTFALPPVVVPHPLSPPWPPQSTLLLGLSLVVIGVVTIILVWGRKPKPKPSAPAEPAAKDECEGPPPSEPGG